MHTKILDAIASPVTASELQDWLELPTAEAKLSGMLVAATDIAMTYIRQAILPTDMQATITSALDFAYKTQFDGYPYVKLSWSALRSVASVTVDGVALSNTEYAINVNTTPGRIHFYGAGFVNEIVVTYEAGLAADATATPEAIKTAIKQIAAYIYEHRGACDSDEALNNSGAIASLRRFRVESF